MRNEGADRFSACSIGPGRKTPRPNAAVLVRQSPSLKSGAGFAIELLLHRWTLICLMNALVPLPRFGRFHFEGVISSLVFLLVQSVSNEPDPERKTLHQAPGDDNNLIAFREEFLLFCFNAIQLKSKFRSHSRPLDQNLTDCACARLWHKFQRSLRPGRNPKKKRPLRVFANGPASRIGNDLSYTFRLTSLLAIQRLKTAFRSH